ncbi:hypothetical protein E2C01_075506 [Portunus trituberculatus]|uniref:Uncharacterized protein n=1 Tax=Portunus trituberculatus TaxID=210409 RepID=A0A5B7I8R5_PORTR|nr:hypothetical protein [Portunus trituberculatus]
MEDPLIPDPLSLSLRTFPRYPKPRQPPRSASLSHLGTAKLQAPIRGRGSSSIMVTGFAQALGNSPFVRRKETRSAYWASDGWEGRRPKPTPNAVTSRL